MSDEDSSVSSHGFGGQHHLLRTEEFRAYVGNPLMRLRDFERLRFRGEDLNKVLPRHIDTLIFEGTANSLFSDYDIVLDLLQTYRSWKCVTLSDFGMEYASPDFLGLVALAQSKTSEVYLRRCPLDRNFFSCFYSGIQTIKLLSIDLGNTPISSEAATVLANGLASSRSLKRLEILSRVRFEDDAAGKELAEGIQRNLFLKELIIDESSLGLHAVRWILCSILEGGNPQLELLSITLKERSDSSRRQNPFVEQLERLVTKLMKGGLSTLKTLIVGNLTPNDTGILWDAENYRLRSLRLWDCSLDKSLTWVLPIMTMLEEIYLHSCGISDLTPIVDYLRLPKCAVKSLSLKGNNIGVDEVEKFVSFLGEMPSLTFLNLGNNPWCNDESEEERILRIVRLVSGCYNLERFIHGSWLADETAAKYNLSLNLRINHAWRRDLCYKNSLGNVPPNLLPLVAARALRKVGPDMRLDPSLGLDVIYSLLQVRSCDLIIE